MLSICSSTFVVYFMCKLAHSSFFITILSCCSSPSYYYPLRFVPLFMILSLVLQALFWYRARSVRGDEGLVPRTFLEIVSGEGTCMCKIFLFLWRLWIKCIAWLQLVSHDRDNVHVTTLFNLGNDNVTFLREVRWWWIMLESSIYWQWHAFETP